MNTFKSRLQQRSGALGRRNCHADHSLRTRLERTAVSTWAMHAWASRHAGGITKAAWKVSTTNGAEATRRQTALQMLCLIDDVNVGEECQKNATLPAGDKPAARARRAFDAPLSRRHGRTCRPCRRLGPDGWGGRVRAAGLSPIGSEKKCYEVSDPACPTRADSL